MAACAEIDQRTVEGDTERSLHEDDLPAIAISGVPRAVARGRHEPQTEAAVNRLWGGVKLSWQKAARADCSRLRQPWLALYLTLNASTQIQEPAEAALCVPVTTIIKVCAPRLRPLTE